jgi:hypothetical protein
MRRTSIALGCVLLGLGLVLALTLAGCGGKNNKNGIASAAGGKGTATPTPSSTLTDSERARLFTQCMQDHGVQVQDPNGGGGKVTIGGGPGGKADPKMQAAMQACKQYLPNGGTPPSMSPADLDKMRKYAACMRAHGIDMKDPTAANPGLMINGGVKPDDPKFKAAQEACKSLLPQGNMKATQGTAP